MAQLVLPHTIDAGTDIVAAEHQLNYVAIRDLINGNLEGGSGVDGNIKANGVTARELADALLLRGLPTYGGVKQEGVQNDGELRVTPGALLALNYAAGTGWVTDDSGLIAAGALLPAVIAGSSVTIAANASGNPRIDQIILTLTGYGTGTVSVLQGTASVGATIANRTGAAALPSNAIRLADVLMPNGFAGPFVQNTHIRDRRPWASGIAFFELLSSGDVALPGAATILAPTVIASRRFEADSRNIRMTYSGIISTNVATSLVRGAVMLNGAVIQAAVSPIQFQLEIHTGLPSTITMSTVLRAGVDFTAGNSVLVGFGLSQNTGTNSALQNGNDPAMFSVESVNAGTAENSGA